MKFYSLTVRNVKEIFRDPVSVLLGLVMPVLFLVLFSSINKSIQIDIFSPLFLTPGVIIFSFAFLIMFSAILLAKDKQTALLDRLFAAPLKPSDFIISYMLPFVPVAIAQIGLCMLTGVLLGAGFTNLPMALFIFLMLALTCISIGILLGSLFNVNQVSGIGSILITLISLFSGAWMDLEMIGGVFKHLGYILPFAHAVDASRKLLGGGSYADIAANAWWIYTYAVVFFVLAVVAFRWKMKK
jgi:ABC-2 type transport system permease protein